MEERKKELDELIGYGNRLLDELSADDVDKITMLRGVFTHIHGIAQEYASDAAIWQGKFEASEETIRCLKQKMREQFARAESQDMQEVMTSLKKLKKAVKKIGKKN